MQFHFGGHILNPGRRELRRDGALVPVEPQVFDLIVHLLRNRDKVVSKDALIEIVWGGRSVSDATIDSRIKAARQAIGDSGSAQSVIRTMARKGVRRTTKGVSPATGQPGRLDAWAAYQRGLTDLKPPDGRAAGQPARYG